MLNRLLRLASLSLSLKSLGKVTFSNEIHKLELKSVKAYVEMTGFLRKVFLAFIAGLFLVQLNLLALIVLLIHFVFIPSVQLSSAWVVGLSSVIVLSTIVAISVICSESFWIRLMRLQDLLNWSMRNVK